MALKSGRVGIHPSQVDPITGMLLSSPGGASDLSDLDDVSIDNPEAGQLLIYDGDKWENQFASISPTALASLQDVSIDNPEEGQQLVYNGSTWENQFASISPLSLAQLRDVEITDLQDGDFITYDSTSEKWINTGETPAPTYIDLTATIYGAVEDTISFTDAAGISHSEVFASGQSSKSVTFKINPSGSTSIIFTSAVAKNPDDLSADYSKSVTITSATTEIKVMPNNALYWYGYFNSLVAHKWQRNPGGGSVSNTENTNSITISGSGGGNYYDLGMYLFDVQISSGSILKAIANASSGQVGTWDTYSPSTSIWLIPNKTYTTANALTSYTLTANGYPSFGLRTNDGSSISFNAFWYE